MKYQKLFSRSIVSKRQNSLRSEMKDIWGSFCQRMLLKKSKLQTNYSTASVKSLNEHDKFYPRKCQKIELSKNWGSLEGFSEIYSVKKIRLLVFEKGNLKQEKFSITQKENKPKYINNWIKGFESWVLFQIKWLREIHFSRLKLRKYIETL